MECLACGYVWGAQRSASSSSVGTPAAVDMGDLGNPATRGLDVAVAASHSDPFGQPAQTPAPQGVPASVTMDNGRLPAAVPPPAHRPPSPPGVPTPATNPAYLPSSSAAAARAPAGPDTGEVPALEEPSADDLPAPGKPSLAGRVLDLMPFAPESPPERFLRTPWAFVAAGLSSFALVVLCGAVVLAATDDPEIRRIDSGRGDEVIREILQQPSGTRTPRQSLLLGHAFALKGQTDVALRHYADAGRGGGADARALEYVLLAMNHPFAEKPMKALAEWQGDLVTQRLRELTGHEDRQLRHNALDVLEEREEANNEDVERVAILDVSSAPLCDDRRAGLYSLDAVGRTSAAVDAIDEMQERFTLKQNVCMRPSEIERVRKKVADR